MAHNGLRLCKVNETANEMNKIETRRRRRIRKTDPRVLKGTLILTPNTHMHTFACHTTNKNGIYCICNKKQIISAHQFMQNFYFFFHFIQLFSYSSLLLLINIPICRRIFQQRIKIFFLFSFMYFVSETCEKYILMFWKKERKRNKRERKREKKGTKHVA